MSDNRYRIGIDVGGTFTAFVLMGAEGLNLLKVPTTSEDQSRGVMVGIGELATGVGLDTGGLLRATDLIVHGTTTADNTMIEMNGAVTGLITTEGHRDEIDIRRGFKEDIWDPAYPPPIPIAPRRRRLGVPERLDFRGETVTELDEKAVRDAIRRLKLQKVESIAVTLLFSFINPAHEKRVAELIAEEYPAARVSLSHEVMPTAPEFERTSTTLVDAYVGPRVESYLRNLSGALRDGGYARELMIMQSNGGIMTADFVARRPISALGSGPAGGVMGAAYVGASTDTPDFIAVDMGGTSYEVAVVQKGRPSIRSFWNWQHRYLIGLPMVEMHSIGAGGGSVAYVEAGALRVGPESAGADPGPVCYGRGGKRVTVTDANLMLGYINPKALCGGAFALDPAGIEAAIEEQIARPLGLNSTDAAYGVFRIVNANMANAIRRVSSQAGLDPREFAMVVYGGNGPVHAIKQAEELGINELLVPKTSPAFSALGRLIADYVVETQRSYISPAGQAEAERIATLFADMREPASSELSRSGTSESDLSHQFFLNLCYPGQNFDMSVPAVTDNGSFSNEDLVRTVEHFHDIHEEAHTFASREEEPVLRAVRLQTTAHTPTPASLARPAVSTPVEDAIDHRRQVYFGSGFTETPVYSGDLLGPGHELTGPAIIEERFTTIVLTPGDRVRVDNDGNYRISRG